ncbi:MAG: DUF1015 domain-containing protein, partial [Phycisphaeraceae bacterium]|nr:DUF1015 domain-containing protein [Phycisphaeraceae bacterium]
EIDFAEDADPYAVEVYERGRANLERLLDADVLVEEDEPGLFVYRLVRNGHRQLGLVCTVDASEYRNGTIRRHEKTRPEKEDDRTRHLDVSSVHAEPVFLAFRDDAPNAEDIKFAIVSATTDRPLMHFVCDDVTHTLWRVKDTAAFGAMFADVPELYIADGHHRSAAGGRIAEERGARNPDHQGDEEYNRILAVVFPESELQILPYNRVVRDLDGMSETDFLERLGSLGTVEAIEDGTTPEPTDAGSVCIRLASGWHRLTFDDATIDRADPIACLDVALLQDRVLGPLLSIGDPRIDDRIGFVGGSRGVAELERLVDAGEWAVAFSMHPTSMTELLRVADAGEIMPPKSTWFEPKLRSGLFAHRFETNREPVQ